MSEPLPVMILWHLHQPLYRAPGDETFKLPWVRKHTLREYHDMAEAIENHPEIAVTVNWTPVLLQQIMEYVDGRRDRQQILRDREPDELSPDEQFELISDAFKAHPATIIDPYPRFRELKEKWNEYREARSAEEIVDQWTTQELRDLQIWGTLGWFGFSAVDNHPEISELREKNKGFAEEDKAVLRDVEESLLESCLSRWKTINETTPVEFSTTPYYHPIGPLITNYSDINEAMPGVPRPERKIQWPEDARWHLQESKTLMEDWLGDGGEPGLWPSEGSLSESFMEAIGDVGFPWVATDEALLRRALSPDPVNARNLNKPYRWHGDVPVFFRHHDLSDRIGFEYSRMKTQNAVNNFLSTVEHLDGETRGESNRVLSVILDGENPWEYFPDAGESFLSNLYQTLLGNASYQTVTPSSYLETERALPTLERMPAGSWINGDFNIWGGSSLDVRAWELLAETREALRGWDNLSQEDEDRCWRALYAAQGSDWFWWYGDPFESADDDIFDQNFRDFLISIYECGGHPEPSYLHHPLQSSESPGYNPPRSYIYPSVDGHESHYREWWGAAHIFPGRERGAMARASERFQEIRFGSNETLLVGRIDFETPPPGDARCHIQLNDTSFIMGPFDRERGAVEFEGETLSDSEWAFNHILEWKIPMEYTDIKPGEYCRFRVELASDGSVFDRFPFGEALTLPVLNQKQAASEWTI